MIVFSLQHFGCSHQTISNRLRMYGLDHVIDSQLSRWMGPEFPPTDSDPHPCPDPAQIFSHVTGHADYDANGRPVRSRYVCSPAVPARIPIKYATDYGKDGRKITIMLHKGKVVCCFETNKENFIED